MTFSQSKPWAALVGLSIILGACGVDNSSSPSNASFSSSFSSGSSSSSSSSSSSGVTSGGSTKPRVLHTTDLKADPDDEQSMVRQLVMSDTFDLEGLIVTTGCHKSRQGSDGFGLLTNILNAYTKAYSNLKVHGQFPTPDYLKSISVYGQQGYGMGDVGSGKNSKGSNLIIAAVDKDDPRPVWATCWGGCNTIAQALWQVKNSRSQAELDKFVSKLRVYDILGQDDAGAWVAKNFPNLLYIRARAVYSWQPQKNGSYYKNDIQSHGDLGGVFPDTIYAPEGDTPAIMHLAMPGLNDPSIPTQGGWGGRFNASKENNIRSMGYGHTGSGYACLTGKNKEEDKYDTYKMYGDKGIGSAQKKWATHYNNDFAARMDWSITPNYSDANHHPTAVVNNVSSNAVMYVSASAGSSVSLDAAGSKDPDGDSLSYNWEFYKEASTYKGSVAIGNGKSQKASVQVPADAKGREIHIILTLKDNGSPALYGYRRVVIKVQ